MLLSVRRRYSFARCAVCSIAPGEPVCAGCEADFFPPRTPRCGRCANRLAGHGTLCGRCLAHAPHNDGTTVLADYLAPVSGMIGALKFSARLDLADVFAQLFAQREPPNSGADMVTAVPLSYERERERGFNQSREIGQRFSRRVSLPYSDEALLRVRHSAPQHVLANAARRRNVKDAFAVAGDVRGKVVMLVDDVMTTGSTLNEIARVLKQAGAKHVLNRVVARTL